MSITADSVKDDVKEAVDQAVPVLNIKIPELVAEIPEIIKDENVKKCLPSFNFVELFRSFISGLTTKKNIVSSV
uniref:Uncharacterized protein n=1 Tax=viral metagenome TaxID=1070528 RepID=A0A6C0LEG0_9ZZZZ